MEAKKTAKTPRTGEKKPMNTDLFREMVNVWNNSMMTRTTATMLSQKLNSKEMKELIEWLRYANRDISNKLANRKMF